MKKRNGQKVRNQEPEPQGFDPELLINGISREVLRALRDSENARAPEERLTCSKTVKNLCDSLGVFLELAANASLASEEDEDFDIPF